jgi:spore coat polysaccharide biosynthesis protein SpsF (cytidylyltransferase family)
MSTGAFLIARLSSSRLPEKGIMRILDKPMIELMVERVQASQLIDKVLIATSTHPSDDPLEELARKLGIGCYRGSLENVMNRITSAANAYDCKTIVELLGDNPLVHSELIDAVIEFYQDGAYDYAATFTKEYPAFDPKKGVFSVGIRVQIYSKAVAKQYVKYPEYISNDSKHPCAYIFEHPETFKVGYFEAKGRWAFMNRPDLTFAVNYRKNFDLIRLIFEKNYAEDKNFSLEKVFKQLDEQRHLYMLMGNE